MIDQKVLECENMEREVVKVVRIRLDLKGDDAEQFTDLLKHRGLTINTQLIRQLLSEAYKKLKEAD